MIFYFFFCVFCDFGGHLENSSFTCMGAQFWRSRSAILRFFVIFEKAKKQFFARVAFSRFFIIFGAFWEAFWLSFGVLLESPSSLWRAGALLLIVFGSSGPSVGRPWALSAAFCGAFGSSGLFLGLGDRSGTVFYSIFSPFWFHFQKILKILKIRGGCF